jgi:hypothetical protein
MKKKNLLLLVALLLTASVSFAQWTDDYGVNTLVCNSTTGDVQTIGTNDGKTWVIYWDGDYSFADLTLYVQLLDVDGNRMFGDNGMIVNDIAPMTTYTAVRSEAVDDSGNLYVSFTATENGDGYLHKISPEGEQLFGENGVIIGGDIWGTKLAPTPDGGVIVGWLNQFTKYDASGAPVWSAPVVITPPNNQYIRIGNIELLSDGSFIIIYHVTQTSWGVESTLYAERYNADGEPMWGNAVQLSQQVTRTVYVYSAVNDNDVIYYAYYGTTGFRFDSFIQRIEPDGVLPWGMDGASFSTNDAYIEFQTSIVYDGSSPYIWATAIISTPNQDYSGQYIQKIDKETGERLLGEYAKEIFSVGTDWVNISEMKLVNKRPLILFTNGISNGVAPIQIGVTLLNEEGDFIWKEQYKFIATTQTAKGGFGFTKNVNNQSVAVWEEDRGYGAKVYAQNIKVEAVDPEYYTITASVEGEGGTIAPTGVITVEEGASQSFTITPNEDHHISQVLIDGNNNEEAVASGSYTFVNVDQDHTIAVMFEKIAYVITALATGNGTISPAGDVEVEHGANQTFNFTPAENYQIGSVIVDNVAVEKADNYTFENVTEAHSIEVVFEKVDGINNIETSQVNVYPNPTTGQLRIANHELGIKNIQVFDMTGRLLHEVQDINHTETILDISNFTGGIYFINIDGKTVKIVKK